MPDVGDGIGNGCSYTVDVDAIITWHNPSGRQSNNKYRKP